MHTNKDLKDGIPMDNNVMKPHIVRRKDRAAHVYIDEGDHIILKVYRGVLRTTMLGA